MCCCATCWPHFFTSRLLPSLFRPCTASLSPWMGTRSCKSVASLPFANTWADSETPLPLTSAATPRVIRLSARLLLHTLCLPARHFFLCEIPQPPSATTAPVDYTSSLPDPRERGLGPLGTRPHCLRPVGAGAQALAWRSLHSARL